MAATAIRRNTREETGAVLRAMELFAHYDSLRLETYRSHGDLAGRIRLKSIGPATALRFDDVGYFNRVYAPAGASLADVEELEVFYQGCPFPCELVGPPDGPSGQTGSACRSRGWVRSKEYTWVGGPISRSPFSIPEHGSFTVAAPSKDQRLAFLSCYLQAFGAQPDRFTAAISNMVHLFEIPQLSFLMAWRDGLPAGVGMLYREGPLAILCAGATLPAQRRAGCHAALLDARLSLAAELGCKEIYSWALLNSQSQANMESAGLPTIGVTPSWRSRELLL